MLQRNQIELLAPAGDEECFKAAIAAGADAVYFGLDQFSARTRAKNLTVSQASYLIPLAHEHNCRAYLTLNTLIKDNELEAALSLVDKAVQCGIDAVIVQDLGVLKLIHQIFPNLELHASTQMTTHNLSQCKFLSGLGVSQVNLSRELSLPEIQNITSLLHSENIVPEIFVQGAFCISYSGQCYLSGHLYNEAGNRGSCVQPCRRAWCCEGKDSDDYKALFHLKDNSAFPIADQLIKENVPLSLKIEGRIKNAEYVWAVTSAWREQIDLILADKPVLKSSPKLTGAINRDYTAGYLEGNISGNMFSSGTKDISQIKAGTVKNYIADSRTLVLQNDSGKLNAGDRLTIKTSSDQFICTATVKEKSGEGYVIQITNKLTKKILKGQVIFKSSSAISPEELNKIINKISPSLKDSGCSPLLSGKQYKVQISVKAIKDSPVEITYSCNGHSVTVKSESLLVTAQNAGLTSETLQEKLTKLGGTAFTCDNFETEILEPGLFLPLGELNSLRRKAVELLETELKEASDVSDKPEGIKMPSLDLTEEKPRTISEPEDAYLIDNEKDLEQLLLERKLDHKSFMIIYELPSAINLVSESLFDSLNRNQDIVLYFNSILLDKNLENTLNFIRKLNSLSERTFISDNTGLAYELKDSGARIILGPNCNIYNSWNIRNYNENLKLSGFIPSLELSPSETESLNFPENLEIWYPKQFHTLLMQSRQCLVRNGSGCTKSRVDRNCIESCYKKLLLKGQHDEKILAVKRPGFYSAIYTADCGKKADFSENFRKKVSVWIIDRRF